MKTALASIGEDISAQSTLKQGGTIVLDHNSVPKGVNGPYINWNWPNIKDQYAGDSSLTINEGLFILNDGVISTDITNNFKKGVVFNIDTMKSGWVRLSPSGIEWVWGFRISHLNLDSDKDWQKATCIEIDLGAGEVGTWVYVDGPYIDTFEFLNNVLKDREPGKLPLIKSAGISICLVAGVADGEPTEDESPTLEIVEWVDRPKSLKGYCIETVLIKPEVEKTDVNKENSGRN